MGREIKRVSQGLDWPIGKVWEGFLNPHSDKCEECRMCEGTGYSRTAKGLHDQWYGKTPFSPEWIGRKPFESTHPIIRKRAEIAVSRSPEFYGSGELAIRSEAKRLTDLFNGSWSHHLNAEDVAALVEEGRLMDFTHTFVKGDGWIKKDPPYTPTPEEVNEWSISPGILGHDSINQWVVIRAECKRLGLDSTCQKCGGDGEVWSNQADREAHDKWEPTEPDAGDCWQVWETVSEGSPVTPAFATKEELIDWLVDKGEGHGTQYERRYTRAQAEAFVEQEWAPSMVFTAERGLETGVEHCETIK